MVFVYAHTPFTLLTGNASTQLKRKKCTDLQIMYENKLKHPWNPLTSYLNINSLRNKIVDVREVFGKLQLDYVIRRETKFDDSFPLLHFTLKILKQEAEGVETKMEVGL